MKLSIWSSYFAELSPEDAVEEFIKNGIYASELSDEHGFMLMERSSDFVETGRKFGEFLKERNFEMSQGHLWLKIKYCSENTIEELFFWVDMYEAIGIKNMVLHCDELSDTNLSCEEKIEKNVAELKKLAEHIKDKDITICLENLRPHFEGEQNLIDVTAEDLLEIIRRVDSPRFGICLDTGHLNLTVKNQGHFIQTAGEKLKALHIADNQGETDQHMMPFTKGNVNFAKVVEKLREVGYGGLFNLEIPGESHIPLELRNAKINYIKACYDYLMKEI